MTKYFNAEVTLHQIVTFNVAADNEVDAQKQARELATLKIPGARVSEIKLTFDGETEFRPGMTIKHSLFGTGTIANLTPTTNAKSERGYRATIEFNDGNTRDIHLPLPKDKLEIIV